MNKPKITFKPVIMRKFDKKRVIKTKELSNSSIRELVMELAEEDARINSRLRPYGVIDGGNYRNE